MACHHKGRSKTTVGVPIPGPRVFERAHLRLRSLFRNVVSMEGRGYYARAWRWVKVSASGRFTPRERGEVDEQAVEVRGGRGQRAEVEVRERPVRVLVPYGESVSVDLAGEVEVGQLVPGAVMRVGGAVRPRAEGHREVGCGI